jgi:SRSO17 transposase
MEGLPMSGASIEQTLDLWSAELRAVKARIQPLFRHASVAASAAAFLDGLLGPERRKTGWMRAEAAGDPGPWRQQAVLGRSRWEAEALRELVRDYALGTLAAPDAVLVIDETGFLKQGTSSCGVQRQYTGSAGKITNCQIGVFAAYVSDRGHAFIDRRLYLPESWTDQPDRLRAAHVPDGVRFTTKPAIAVAMIERALKAGISFAWVAADSVYGVGEVEKILRRAGKGYVLGVTGTHPFRSWGKKPGWSGTAETIAASLPPSAYVRLSAGDGTKGAERRSAPALRLGLPGAGGPGGGGRGLRRRSRGVDTWSADPAQPGRPKLGVLHDLVPAGHPAGGAGPGRGLPLGDRGRVRDRQE